MSGAPSNTVSIDLVVQLLACYQALQSECAQLRAQLAALATGTTNRRGVFECGTGMMNTDNRGGASGSTALTAGAAGGQVIAAS